MEQIIWLTPSYVHQSIESNPNIEYFEAATFYCSFIQYLRTI